MAETEGKLVNFVLTFKKLPLPSRIQRGKGELQFAHRFTILYACYFIKKA